MTPSPEGRRPPLRTSTGPLTGFVTPCSVSDPVKDPFPCGASRFTPCSSMSESTRWSYPGAFIHFEVLLDGDARCAD